MRPRVMVQLKTLLQDKVFGKHLFWTNTLTCGGLMAGGDVAVQLLEKKISRANGIKVQGQDKINWARTARLGLMGIALGPFNHYWYMLLDKVLPGTTVSIIGRKILCDQIVASPYFTFTFFTGTALLEGHTWQESLDVFKEKFWPVYKADWSFWPPVQCINFYFLAPKYRVFYVSMATFVWDMILSFMKHNENHTCIAKEPQYLEGQMMLPAPTSVISTSGPPDVKPQ